jgi:hypothetical protein
VIERSGSAPDEARKSGISGGRTATISLSIINRGRILGGRYRFIDIRSDPLVFPAGFTMTSVCAGAYILLVPEVPVSFLYSVCSS